MDIVSQLLTLVPFLLLYGSFESGKRDFFKDEKRWKWLTQTIIILLITGIFYRKYPTITLGIWISFFILLPMFFIFTKYFNSILKRIYNIVFSSLFLYGIHLMVSPGIALKILCHYLGFKFNQVTEEYCCDREGDSSTRDFFYVNSGNSKLDYFLSNYFIYFIALFAVLLLFYFIEIDKRIRDEVVEREEILETLRRDDSD